MNLKRILDSRDNITVITEKRSAYGSPNGTDVLVCRIHGANEIKGEKISRFRFDNRDKIDTLIAEGKSTSLGGACYGVKRDIESVKNFVEDHHVDEFYTLFREDKDNCGYKDIYYTEN